MFRYDNELDDKMWLASGCYRTCVALLDLDIDGMIAQSGRSHVSTRCVMRSEQI